MVNGSRAKTHRGQAVEAIFWWPGNEATLGEKPPLAISKYGGGIYKLFTVFILIEATPRLVATHGALQKK